MIVSLILAHPHPGSLNHAIAEAARDALQQKGHQVAFHDLYREGFDPVLPFEEVPRGVALDLAIERYCHEIASADGIVIVHPNWWGMPPAILKGWVDRILRPGVAYEFLEGDSGKGVPRGLLKAKTALVFNTSNTPCERELRVFGDPLEKLWKSCIFDLCGVKEFYRTTYCVVVTSTALERNLWLDDVRAKVERYFPMEA
ncbi:MAG TPA: NAD(P)H-dependent oxidoreductase [Methanothrix sp.]|nr:NAD(P)H-dependent oxidoreductase [Methanothrix sp.]